MNDFTGGLTEYIHESQDDASQVDNNKEKVAGIAEDDLSVLSQPKVEDQDTCFHQGQCRVL